MKSAVLHRVGGPFAIEEVDELISRRYSLDRINEGYADMLAGGHKRGVLIFD